MALQWPFPNFSPNKPSCEGAENGVEGEGFAIPAGSQKDEAHKGAQMDWG